MKNCKITGLGIWIKDDNNSEYLSSQVKINLDGELIVKNYFSNFDVQDGQEFACNYPKKTVDEYGIVDDKLLIRPKNSKTFLVGDRIVEEWLCTLLFKYRGETYKLTVPVHKNERTRAIQPHFKMQENHGRRTSLLAKLNDNEIYRDDEIISSEIEDSRKEYQQQVDDDMRDSDDYVPPQEDSDLPF